MKILAPKIWSALLGACLVWGLSACGGAEGKEVSATPEMKSSVSSGNPGAEFSSLQPRIAPQVSKGWFRLSDAARQPTKEGLMAFIKEHLIAITYFYLHTDKGADLDVRCDTNSRYFKTLDGHMRKIAKQDWTFTSGPVKQVAVKYYGVVSNGDFIAQAEYDWGGTKGTLEGEPTSGALFHLNTVFRVSWTSDGWKIMHAGNNVRYVE